MTLRIGHAAPEFEKTTQKGETITLAKLRGVEGEGTGGSKAKGNRAVVLYFYPKDETPGCTAEACSFRDAYEDFVDAGAVVVGVSADSLASHEQFAAHHRLPFELISDEDGALRRAYNVPTSMLGLLPGRVTYVIDRDGKVQHVFNSQLQAKRHVEEALEVVRRITRAPR